MIINSYYMSVGLFCSVFNDFYSKMFMFGLLGAIMTNNEINFGLEASLL